MITMKGCLFPSGFPGFHRGVITNQNGLEWTQLPEGTWNNWNRPFIIIIFNLQIVQSDILNH